LGRGGLGAAAAVERTGPDQPDRGVERAGRAGLGRRLAPRPAHAVAGRRGADGRGAAEAGAGGPPASGQSAGYRLVHRLRRAVHDRGLPGAGSAAPGRKHRGGGTTRMRRFRWLCLALLPVLAVAGNRDDYARQWPLQLAEVGAGAYRVELDEAVYRTAIDPRLGDVEVFDAAGVALPAAVTVAARPARAEPRVQPLPWFPLPAPVPTVGGGDLRLVVERDDNGSVRRIEADAGGGTAAGGGAAQWLVDATGLA